MKKKFNTNENAYNIKPKSERLKISFIIIFIFLFFFTSFIDLPVIIESQDIIFCSICSIPFFIFCILYNFIFRKEKSMMIYSSVFWGITLISVIKYIIDESFDLNDIFSLSFLFTIPVYTVSSLLNNDILVYISEFIISFIYFIWGIINILKMKKFLKHSVD